MMHIRFMCVYLHFSDIDECTENGEFDDLEETWVKKPICTDECVNTMGSFICKCRENFHLLDDKKTCERDFCRHLGNVSSNKTKCSHDCVDGDDGYHCYCPDGMTLQEDGKTCAAAGLDMCATSGDNCLPGKCINTNDGLNFRCECPSGFASVEQGQR